MDSEDRTLLMKFVEQGNLEAVKTLLDKGADVDAARPATDDGTNAIAALVGHLEAAETASGKGC